LRACEPPAVGADLTPAPDQEFPAEKPWPPTGGYVAGRSECGAGHAVAFTPRASAEGGPPVLILLRLLFQGPFLRRSMVRRGWLISAELVGAVFASLG